MPKPDKPPGQGRPQQSITLSATLHNLPDTCAIIGKVGINATLNLQEARDTCAVTGRNFVSARLPIIEARNTCLIQGNITFKTTANLSIQEARNTCAIGGDNLVTSSDFAIRRSAPGVIRSFALNSNTDLGTNQNFAFTNYGWGPGVITNPVIDTTVGALRFDIPQSNGVFTNGNVAGYWMTNFSSDLSQLFGVGKEFWIQIRTYWNNALYNTNFLDINGDPQAGIKLFDVVAGDTPDGRFYFSSANLKTVLQTNYQWRYPHTYGYDAFVNTYNFDEIFGSDFKKQNAMLSPFCLFSTTIATTPPAQVVGCFNIFPNEWMTWKEHFKILNRVTINGNSCFNFEYQAWGCREGGSSIKMIDWSAANPGYVPLLAEDDAGNPIDYGKTYLFPFLTGKSDTQTHPLCQVWYKELIISTQDIADPAAGPFASLAPNHVQDLGAFTCTEIPGDTSGSTSRQSVDFCGMIYDGARRQMVTFGGGHASTNYDVVHTFKLDTLQWVEEYPPTPAANITLANYDFDKGAWITGSDGGPYERALARHTEDLLAIVGDELIVLASVEGNQVCPSTGINSTLAFLNQLSKLPQYNFTTKTWSFSTTQSGGYATQDWPGTAVDPVTGLVVIMGQVGGLETYDPTTRVRTTRIASGFLQDANGNVISLSNLEYNNNLAYYPPGDCFYYFRSGLALPNGVFKLTLNRSNYAASFARQVTTTGTPPPTAFEVAARYDTKNHVFGVGPVNNIFYTFDPESAIWSPHTVQGGAPGSQTFHMMDYDPVNNVFIFVTNQVDGYKTWAYRYA